jgi:uncharacterized membrane protein YqhA
VRLLYELVFHTAENSHAAVEEGQGLIIFEVVEFVHTFLVCTVLYITAVDLYQLFIRELNFVSWLKIESTEEPETNLIDVTVVVLAVNFMGAVFAGKTTNILLYRAGIALPIAALGLFVGLRALAVKLGKETYKESNESKSKPLIFNLTSHFVLRYFSGPPHAPNFFLCGGDHHGWGGFIPLA